MRATAEPVTAKPASTGTTTIQREMDIKRPPKTESGQTSHRHPNVPRWSPIVVVIAPAFGVALWHGGFPGGGRGGIAGVPAARAGGFPPPPPPPTAPPPPLGGGGGGGRGGVGAPGAGPGGR